MLVDATVYYFLFLKIFFIEGLLVGAQRPRPVDTPLNMALIIRVALILILLMTPESEGLTGCRSRWKGVEILQPSILLILCIISMQPQNCEIYIDNIGRWKNSIFSELLSCYWYPLPSNRLNYEANWSVFRGKSAISDSAAWRKVSVQRICPVTILYLTYNGVPAPHRHYFGTGQLPLRSVPAPWAGSSKIDSFLIDSGQLDFSFMGTVREQRDAQEAYIYGKQRRQFN